MLAKHALFHESTVGFDKTHFTIFNPHSRDPIDIFWLYRVDLTAGKHRPDRFYRTEQTHHKILVFYHNPQMGKKLKTNGP